MGSRILRTTILLLLSLLLIITPILFNAVKEVDRYRRNFNAVVKDNSIAIEVTKLEFRKLYSQIDSLSRELGKKPKHIVQVVKVDYVVKDTAEAALTGDTVYIVRNDTIFVQPDTMRFNIEKPCYKLTGYVFNSRIKAEIDFRDKPMVIFDRERSKRFLFIKYGPWQYSATFYSQCSGNTMWIQQNILIKRK